MDDRQLTADEREAAELAERLLSDQDARAARGDFSVTLEDELARWARVEQELRRERRRRGLPAGTRQIVVQRPRVARAAAAPLHRRAPRRRPSRRRSSSRGSPREDESDLEPPEAAT